MSRHVRVRPLCAPLVVTAAAFLVGRCDAPKEAGTPDASVALDGR